MYRKFVQDEVLDNGIIKGHMESIRTNADRIRSMTDEELADFLQDIANLGGVNGLQKIMTWIEWLKEEAKDGSPEV